MREDSKNMTKKCKHSPEPSSESEQEQEEWKDDKQESEMEQREIGDCIVVASR